MDPCVLRAAVPAAGPHPVPVPSPGRRRRRQTCRSRTPRRCTGAAGVRRSVLLAGSAAAHPDPRAAPRARPSMRPAGPAARRASGRPRPCLRVRAVARSGTCDRREPAPTGPGASRYRPRGTARFRLPRSVRTSGTRSSAAPSRATRQNRRRRPAPRHSSDAGAARRRSRAPSAPRCSRAAGGLRRCRPPRIASRRGRSLPPGVRSEPITGTIKTAPVRSSQACSSGGSRRAGERGSWRKISSG